MNECLMMSSREEELTPEETTFRGVDELKPKPKEVMGECGPGQLAMITESGG